VGDAASGVAVASASRVETAADAAGVALHVSGMPEMRLNPDIADESVLALGESNELDVENQSRKRQASGPIEISSESEAEFPETLRDSVPAPLQDTIENAFADSAIE
jgi:hypothetical protein